MNFAEIRKRAQNIMKEPKREFIIISKEKNKPLVVLIEFILPFMVVFALASYLGKIVFSPATFNVGTGIVLKNILLLICVTLLGIYLSSLIVNEILPAFHAKRNLSNSFSLIAYSLTPIYITLILSGLIPNLAMLFYFIGFYSLVLFWIASAAIIDMTKERRQIFVPVSILIVIITFLIIRIILGVIFSL